MNVSIADSQLKSCTAPCAERLRQAFVGYDNLPPDTESQPIRVYIHDSHKRGRLRLGVNEFQTLANRLPIATVCSEGRSQAINFCREKVKFVDLWYAVNTIDEPSEVGDEILGPISVQPTTVMVTNSDEERQGTKGFDSAEHLVDIVNHVFGKAIERVVLNYWFDSHNTLGQMYWLHTAQTMGLRQYMHPVFIDDPSHDRFLVFMTPERAAYVRKELCYGNVDNLQQLAHHLLKFHEILDASKQKLLQLQKIELKLHTYSWGKMYPTHIQATNKDGVLWVNWSDVQIGTDHMFANFDDPVR